MRAIGSINLQIGLINIPLRVNSFLDYKGIGFIQLCPHCETPISYKRVCLKCNRDIEFNDLKSGFEISKDNIIVVDKEVFKTLENYPTKILAIITTNTEFEFITEKCYLLTPQKNATKQYFLLLKTLTLENKSLVIEFVMRKKIHLAIVKPTQFNNRWYLMLKEILYSDKIKEIEEIKEENITEEEIKLCRELLNIINQKIENKSYLDIKDKRVELLEKLIKGEINIEREIKTSENDIIEQLKSSVEKEKVRTIPKKAKKGVKNV